MLLPLKSGGIKTSLSSGAAHVNSSVNVFIWDVCEGSTRVPKFLDSEHKALCRCLHALNICVTVQTCTHVNIWSFIKRENMKLEMYEFNMPPLKEVRRKISKELWCWPTEGRFSLLCSGLGWTSFSRLYRANLLFWCSPAESQLRFEPFKLSTVAHVCLQGFLFSLKKKSHFL